MLVCYPRIKAILYLPSSLVEEVETQFLRIYGRFWSLIVVLRHSLSPGPVWVWDMAMAMAMQGG